MSDGKESKEILLRELQKSIEEQSVDYDMVLAYRLYLLKYILDLDALLERRNYNPEVVIREIENEVKQK